MTRSPSVKKEDSSPMATASLNGHENIDYKATPSTDHVISSLSKATLSSATSHNSDISAPSTTTATPETVASTMPDSTDEKPEKTEHVEKQSSGLQLFLEYPSATEEATSTFSVIGTCTYTPMKLGNTDQEEPMACDCGSDNVNGVNMACMPGSDCINVNTSMECTGDSCGCGPNCRNQRFQRREWADVSVIKTEQKGYGLRADKQMEPDTFIFEYVGEVIDEPRYHKRRMEYDKEGIKHFYFMSLAKNQFIDATKKGNLARFCNHSCNPNCYVEKWIVGKKFRMGIFAKREIEAGEELTFDYNVDRYGSEAQKCWCGEPNCLGFIGGKTQTDGGKQMSTRKISDQVSEALGLEVSRKGRKVVGVDEDYLKFYEPLPLDAESSISVIMGVLLVNEEDYIVAKILERIRRCEDIGIQREVMRLHGYQIMNTLIKRWIDNRTIILNILNILIHWPNETKNKITASKIEGTIQELTESDCDEVSAKASELLEVWSRLKTGYRIPRRIRQEGDDNDANSPSKGPGDSSTGNNSPATSTAPPSGPASATGPPFRKFTPKAHVPGAPKGPKSQIQEQEDFNKPLPPGWTIHFQNNRRCYQSTDRMQISYTFPTTPYHPQTVIQKSKNSILEKVMQQSSSYLDLDAKRRAEEQERERRRREEENRKREEEAERERRAKELDLLLQKDMEQEKREAREKRKRLEAEKKLKEKRKNVEKKLTEPEIERALLKTHGPIMANLMSKKNPWLLHNKRNGPDPPPKEDWKLLVSWASKKVVAAEMKKKGEYYCNLRKVPEKGTSAYIKMEKYVSDTLSKGRTWILSKISELKAEKAASEANGNQSHPHSSVANATPMGSALSSVSANSPAVPTVSTSPRSTKRAREEEGDTSQDLRSPKRHVASEEAHVNGVSSGPTPSVDEVMTDVSHITHSFTENSSHTSTITAANGSTTTLVQKEANIMDSITSTTLVDTGK